MGEVYRPLTSRLHGQLQDEDRCSAYLYSDCKVLYIAMRQCCQLDSLGNLHLHLLQAILVPALQYGCQIWGMHSPRAAVANDAYAALQRLYDYYLRTIYRLLLSTPRRLLLTELGLLPLRWFPLPRCPTRQCGQPYRCFSGGCLPYG